MLFVIGQIYTRDELFIQAAYPSDSYGNLFWTVWKPGKRIWWHFSFHSWNKNEHLVTKESTVLEKLWNLLFQILGTSH